MKMWMVVGHKYLTDEFYGASIPNIVSEVFEVSNPESRKLIRRMELKRGEMNCHWPPLNMTGHVYQWMLRQEEILSSARDYERTIDINSITTKYDELIYIPNTIKRLIGLFCDPVIASGYIIIKLSEREENISIQTI